MATTTIEAGGEKRDDGRVQTTQKKEQKKTEISRKMRSGGRKRRG